MICMTCGIDIPSTFKKVLASGICCGCEGPIMTEDGKVLMEELSSALEKMPNDPQGLAGWLLSNYSMKKIGDGQPVNAFYSPEAFKQGQAAQQQQMMHNQPFPPNVNKFFANAGLIPKNNAHQQNPGPQFQQNQTPQQMPLDPGNVRAAAQRMLSQLTDQREGNNNQNGDLGGADYSSQEEANQDQAYFNAMSSQGRYDAPPNFMGDRPPINNSALGVGEANLPPLQNKEIMKLNNIFDPFAADREQYQNKQRLEKLSRDNLVGANAATFSRNN